MSGGLIIKFEDEFIRFCGVLSLRRGHSQTIVVNLFPEKVLPAYMDLVNDLQRILLAFVLAIECKRILRLPISCLVHLEPLANLIQLCLPFLCSSQIFHSLQTTGPRVIHINGNDLPIRLTLINHGQAAQYLHLVDGSHGQTVGADLHKINRICITHTTCVRVRLIGVLKRLRDQPIIERDPTKAHLIREVPQLILLTVLLDGVLL
mmetsp:Transcript_39980/g.66562  ORF Transcript_39980/g.66562 Transcript_39980/m.66562 type:complete len:206 (+) Transcript_39980:297-914(+)